MKKWVWVLIIALILVLVITYFIILNSGEESVINTAKDSIKTPPPMPE